LIILVHLLESSAAGHTLFTRGHSPVLRAQFARSSRY
jgi:hypothetical protein